MKSTLEQLRLAHPRIGELKDIVRKVGSGVSSYPLMRFYLLFEGADPTTSEDDQFWSMKELADRPAPPGLPLYPTRQFGAQGHRVVSAREHLQWGTSDDLNFTWVDVGNLSFRMKRWTGFERGASAVDLFEALSVSETAEERIQANEDLKEVALLLGKLLAGSHAFAPTLLGYLDSPSSPSSRSTTLTDLGPSSRSLQQSTGGEIINADLNRGGRTGLFEETATFVRLYGQQLFLDKQRLEYLIQVYSPSLGVHLDEDR